MFSEVINIGTNNQQNKQTEVDKFVIIPIECEPTQHQMYSLNIMHTFEFKNPANIYIKFTDMDNNPLRFTREAVI